MPCLSRKSFLFALCFSFLFVNLSFAQQTPNAAPGFRSDGVYDFDGIDNVSLFNGALSLTIPIGIDYPVAAGFSYQLSLRYSSSPWDSRSYSDPCTASGCPIEFQPKQTHDAGLGWRLALPELLPEDNPWNQTQSWIYVGANGGEHAFYETLHPSDADDPGDSSGFGGVQLVQYSRDGSYLRFKRASADATVATVELSGGHIHTFEKVGSEWRLRRMEDLHGNGVDLTYGNVGTNLTTTLSDGFRSHVITYADQGAAFPEQRFLVSKIELAAFGGATATYRFDYVTKTANRPAAHNVSARSMDVRVLQSISLPAGTEYVMGTDQAPSYQADGMLTQLRLPTLGYLEWDWEPFAFPVFKTKPPSESDTELVEPFNVVMAVSNRRQKAIGGGVLGEWTYTRELDHVDGLGAMDPLPERLTVTVQRPLGDKSEHFFSVYPAREGIGWKAPDWGTKWNEYSLPYTRETPDPEGGPRFLSSKIYDCDEDGDPCKEVRAVYVEYELDPAPGGSPSNINDASGILFNKNRRLKSQRTIDFFKDADGADQSHERLEVFSDFDGLGRYRRTTVSSDFGSTRTQTTTFNPGSGTYPGSFTQIGKTSHWITGLYDAQTTTENGRTAKREFCFSAEGELLRTRILKGDDGARDPKDILQIFEHDSKGQVISQEWHGGDLYGSGLAVDAAPCEITGLFPSVFRIANTYSRGVLATSRYTQADGTPFDFFLTNHTAIDAGTGLVSASRGPSGLETTFTFDTSSRLTLISPSEQSGAAATKIFYDNARNTSQPARIEVRELENDSADNEDTLTETRYHYDGLGRLSRERRARPTESESFADRYTFYDAEGRERGSTSWGTAASGTSAENFDPFGRPRVIYPPDANASSPAHAVYIAYEGFQKVHRTVNVGTAFDGDGVEENAVTRTEQYDAHGRLVAVTEPSGSSDVTTAYVYDVADRLISASTPINSLQTQTRTWSYDQRGFLTRECHPEKGAGGNGCVSYVRYDPFGQARKVTDGPFVRLYDYDRASRLTGVREEVSGGSRQLKSFTYGTASAVGNHALGQVVQATSYQYPLEDAFESRMVEEFRYGGPGGVRDYRKVSWVKECDLADIKVDCEDDGFATEEVFEHSETFDPTGKIASITYPICIDRDDGCGPQAARTVNYGYHVPSGFLSSVTGFADLAYHSNLTVSEVRHSNGVTDVQGIDPHAMARPASIHSAGPDGDVLWQTGTFQFDGAGNLVRLAADSFTDRFRYDGVSRLVESEQWVGSSAFIFRDGFESGDLSDWNTTSDGLQNQLSRQTYTFDVVGNLTQVATDGVVRNQGITSLTNRVAAATYDGAGNLTRYVDGDGVQVDLVYDPFNRLIERNRGGVKILYFYTADDERIMRFEDGAFSWSLRDLRGRLLREFRPEAAGMVAQRDQIYRGLSLLATVTRSHSGALTEVHHYHLDHLGSPRIITDAAGRIESDHRYYPFGEEATSTGQNDHPMKFTGHERDFNQAGEGDDLDYMHARYCDPLMGRFLSVDPVQGTPERPQSWNRYAYVQGNPMMLVDPDGRESAGIMLDIDNEGLLDGTVTPQLHRERRTARAEGAMLGVSIVEFGVLVSGAAGSGVLASAADILKGLFSSQRGTAKKGITGGDLLEEVLPSTPKPPRLSRTRNQVHGNSNSATGPHDVYVVRDIDTREVLRFGETGRGFLVRGEEHVRAFGNLGIKIDTELLATVEGKAAARALENRYITTYKKIFGQRPPYNFSNN